MLADDDADDRDLFSEAVNEHNAQVTCVINGVQLMKTIEGGMIPDVIFLDLNMPEKNGKECLREIRDNDSLKNIPVVIYSTSSSKKDQDDTFELGAALYVVKPTSYTTLRKTMAGLMSLPWHDWRKPSREKFIYKA